jgi:hypothetical protein
MRHLLFFSHQYTFIYERSLHLTTPVATVNKDVLVNDISFIIKINITHIRHFLWDGGSNLLSAMAVE